MTRLDRILLTLALIGAAGPALADPATLVITALGVSSTSVAAFAIRIGVGLAMSALANALSPANRAAAPSGIVLKSLTAGEQMPQSFILGRYATPGNLVAPEMSHGVDGDTRYLTRVVDLSDVVTTGLDALIINGKLCELATGSPSTLTMSDGDGTTPAIHPDYGPTVTRNEFVGFVWCRYKDGNQTVADPMLLDKYGSDPERPWTSAMVGRAVSYAALTFLWRDTPQIWQGRPDVRFIVQGIRLYDPRKDSTAGGSGAHRYGNVATHEWSENPVVMIYNILRGIQIRSGHVFGGGFTAADLPYATWAAAMNKCDVLIGGRKTYTAGLEVAMGGSDAGGMSPADVVEELLKTCAGQIADVGGEILIRVGAPGLPVKFITDDDIIVTEGQELDPFPGAEDSYNVVHATWVNPALLWTVKEAEPRRDADAITADGQELTATIALPAVTNGKQVQQLTAAWLKDAQRHRRHTITLPPEGLLIRPLDVIDWTSMRNGYAGKDFEVGQVVIDPMTLCTTLAIREVNPDDYDWTTGDEIAVDAPSAETVTPTAQVVPGWNVAATTIKDGTGTDRLPALRFTWSTPLPGVTSLRYQVRVSGTNTVAVEGSTANADQGYHVVSEGIVKAVTYQARARLVGPERTAWTGWVTATAPDVGITDADFQGGIEQVFRNAGLAPVEIVSALPTTGNFEGRTVYLTTDNKLYRWDGTQWTAAVETVDLVGQIVADQVADGAINTAKFAAGIAPVEIVSALPTTGNFEGRTVYLTTDNKLYRYTGTAWTAAVPAVDITGQLTDAQIADIAAAKLTGQITAPQIATSAVTADKIAAQAVTVAKFATGIAPVEIVSSLPTTGNFEGRTVYLTTDDKLYRHTGSPTGAAGFTAAVPAADVTGQLTNAQIADVAAAKLTGQIAAPQIADGAVTDAKIAGMAASKVTGQLTNAQIADIAAAKLTGQITTTQITDNAVTTAKVNAGAVTTAKLAAGAVTADTIAANAVTAAKIAAGSVEAAAIAAGAVQADKIAAGAVTAAKIAANAIDATKIAAGTITSVELASGSVTTAKLAAGAVTADTIAANAITTAKINAAAVTANEIASNAVTSAKIAADAVTAGKIAAGAISATEIAAGAITASKLAIADTTNLVPDGQIQEAAAWSNATNFEVISTTSANPPPSKGELRYIGPYNVGTALSDSLDFDVVAGREYWFQYVLGRINGTTYRAYAQLRYSDKAGALLSGAVLGSATTDRTGLATVEGSVTVPANAVRARWRWVVDTDVTDSNVRCWAPTIRVKSGGELIVDGAITAAKIAASAVTADKIAASAIDATKIAAGAITSVELASGAVTTAKLAAGAVTADTIAADAVTTAKIAAGAVTATEIAAGAVTAAKIAADSITGGQIAAGAISTSELAADAVTATKIAAGAVTADAIAANAITAGKIAADAVTSAKIAANAVTSDKIAANAITAGLIAAGAIDTQDLIVDGAVSRRVYGRSTDFVTTTTTAQTVATRSFASGRFVGWQGSVGDRSNPILLNLDIRFDIYSGGTGWEKMILEAAIFQGGSWLSPFLVNDTMIPLEAEGPIQFSNSYVIDSGNFSTATQFRVRVRKSAAFATRVDVTGGFMLTQISV